MKPKNKLQQQIFDLSKKLPPITKAQVKWAYNNCIEHFGRRTKKGAISCLECGHTWTNKTNGKHCNCPKCDTKLTVIDTKKRVFKDYQYLCIVTAYEGFQVLRFVYIDYRAKVGEKAHYFHSEVVQRWTLSNGKSTTLARLRPMSYFTNTWCFSSSLEIRANKQFHNITPTCIYPRQKLIPEIKRSGFSGEFYGLAPFDVFRFILSEGKAETLLKSAQTELFKYFVINTFKNINKYWFSIRICLRNGYKPHNAVDWCDYIDLLRFFNKDLYNSKYVCPFDLKTEHDRYVKKKSDFLEKERKDEAKKRALENESTFKEMKAKFFGIQFSDGLISVKMLESVDEIMLEGEAMHHCVFTNDYHLKPDSIIFSASMNGQRLETIEFSLTKLMVVQSRGICNQNTEYHNRIIKLVKQHIPLIKKRIVA